MSEILLESDYMYRVGDTCWTWPCRFLIFCFVPLPSRIHIESGTSSPVRTPPTQPKTPKEKPETKERDVDVGSGEVRLLLEMISIQDNDTEDEAGFRGIRYARWEWPSTSWVVVDK